MILWCFKILVTIIFFVFYGIICNSVHKPSAVIHKLLIGGTEKYEEIKWSIPGRDLN